MALSRPAYDPIVLLLARGWKAVRIPQTTAPVKEGGSYHDNICVENANPLSWIK
jgi:hypothetical protein